MKFSKTYDNGETVVAKRIEEESWYHEYQWFMELVYMDTHEPQPDELANRFLNAYGETTSREYEDRQRVLRWAILHSERLKWTNYTTKH